MFVCNSLNFLKLWKFNSLIFVLSLHLVEKSITDWILALMSWYPSPCVTDDDETS